MKKKSKRGKKTVKGAVTFIKGAGTLYQLDSGNGFWIRGPLRRRPIFFATFSRPFRDIFPPLYFGRPLVYFWHYFHSILIALGILCFNIGRFGNPFKSILILSSPPPKPQSTSNQPLYPLVVFRTLSLLCMEFLYIYIYIYML